MFVTFEDNIVFSEIWQIELDFNYFSSMEEKDRAAFPISSCVSLKSDRSKGDLPDFSEEPGPSNPK